jgi:hypothetical protein
MRQDEMTQELVSQLCQYIIDQPRIDVVLGALLEVTAMAILTLPSLNDRAEVLKDFTHSLAVWIDDPEPRKRN